MFNSIFEKKQNSGGGSSDLSWKNERPKEWLTIPEVTESEQVIYFLIAVFENSPNSASFIINGAYQVEWGDGNIQGYTSGSKAEHLFDFNSPSLNSDTLEKYGYKQALIKVTPQSGNFTVINLDQNHSEIWTTGRKNSNFIDIVISASNATLTLSSSGTTSNSTFLNFSLVKHVNIFCNLFSTSSQFITFLSLEFVEINIKSAYSCISLFRGCSLLKKVKGDLKPTYLEFLFWNCQSLEDLSELNISATSSTITSVFLGCSNLRKYPVINLDRNQSNIASFFSNNLSLFEIPDWFYDNSLKFTGTNTNDSTFNGCINLNKVVNLNMQNKTSFSSFFSGCRSLNKVVNFQVSSSTTNVNNLFQDCTNLSKLTTNIPISFSIINCSFSATALNELFTSLPTVSSATLTITGNYGASGCDTSIATAKGRTITS